MKHSDFKIGKVFVASAGFEWLCTDVGARTINAIMLDPDKDPTWFNGPPYAVNEVVFDENDFSSCHRDQEEAITDAMDSSENSGHPGYEGETVFRMMRARGFDDKYPNKRLFKLDRMDESGELLHPYAARKEGDQWVILLHLPFLMTDTEMPELEFIKLELATPEKIKQRSLRKK